MKDETKIWKQELISLLTDKINKSKNITQNNMVCKETGKKYYNIEFGNISISVDKKFINTYFNNIEEKIK